MNFERIDFQRNMEVCVQFRRDSYEASFPGSDEWKELWDEDGYRKWVVAHAERFPDGALHFISDGEIIGQLEFAYLGDVGHVNLFYLKPLKRGKGYGSVLQEHVESTLRCKGCVEATLRVSHKNERAIRFYTKHGWIGCGSDRQNPRVHVYKIEL